MTYKADLHTHSYYSDGTLSPEEILSLAKELSLSAISITDHDTMSAYKPSLIEKAKEERIELITGVEISSQHNHEDIHVLGYNIPLEDEPFFLFLQDVAKERMKRNLMILQKLRSCGISISDEEFLALADPEEKILGRPHIAYLLQKKRVVSDLKEAFQKFLKRGACCYIPVKKYTTLDVIGKIHLSGGKAVLAHPHFIRSKKQLSDLLRLPFNGIEAEYGLFSEEDKKRIKEIGQEKSWIITGGSDFHGSVKPHIHLGCSYVGKDAVDKLKS